MLTITPENIKDYLDSESGFVPLPKDQECSETLAKELIDMAEKTQNPLDAAILAGRARNVLKKVKHLSSDSSASLKNRIYLEESKSCIKAAKQSNYTLDEKVFMCAHAADLLSFSKAEMPIDKVSPTETEKLRYRAKALKYLGKFHTTTNKRSPLFHYRNLSLQESAYSFFSSSEACLKMISRLDKTLKPEEHKKLDEKRVKRLNQASAQMISSPSTLLQAEIRADRFRNLRILAESKLDLHKDKGSRDATHLISEILKFAKSSALEFECATELSPNNHPLLLKAALQYQKFADYCTDVEKRVDAKTRASELALRYVELTSTDILNPQTKEQKAAVGILQYNKKNPK